MSASENKVVKEACDDSNQGVFIYFLSRHVSWNMHISVCRFLSSDELFVKIVADEEEVEHAWRMTNWAAINDLVEEDENDKRKLVYSPGICQRPGRRF